MPYEPGLKSDGVRGRWERLFLSSDILLSHRIPKVPACYAIFLDGELAYVGSSDNLRARMTAHKIAGHTMSECAWTPWGLYRSVELRFSRARRRGDWLMREYRLIKRLNPPMNIRTTNRGSTPSRLLRAIRLDGQAS